MRISILALCLLVGLIAGAASGRVWAQESNVAPDSTTSPQADYSRPGPYVGLVGGYSFQKLEASGDVSDSWALGGRLGWRLHPVFATELAVDHYRGFDLDDAGSTSGVSVMAVGKLYSGVITGRIQPYVSLGLGIAYFDADDDDKADGIDLSGSATEFASRFGGGLDVYLTENILFNAEALYFSANGSLNGLDCVPIFWGVQYRF